MITTQQRIRRNTDWLTNALDPLYESRLKGTHRPWKQTDLTPEQQARLDAEARAEKSENAAHLFGESPAPLHLDVLDRYLDIKATTHRLAQDLATTTGDGPTLVHLARIRTHRPGHLLHYIQDTATKLDEEDHEQGATLEEIANELGRLVHATAAHFAEVVDGQRLKAHCPWCDQPKLYIRLIGPEHHPEPVIRCESTICEPPPSDCGTFHRGHPTWPLHEWAWLSGHLNHHNDQPIPA